MNYSEYFIYSLNSPSGLFWKIDYNWTGKYFRNKKGDVVGTIIYQHKNQKPQGYRVRINKKSYAIHRIIYEMHNGKIPENMVIDHIDRNPLNNAIDNLRIVSRAINNRNQSMHKNNKSGKTGVQITSDGRFRVTWKEEGKVRSKSFSISKYGYDQAKQLSFNFRDSILNKLKLIYNYSENHGE